MHAGFTGALLTTIASSHTVMLLCQGKIRYRILYIVFFCLFNGCSFSNDVLIGTVYHISLSIAIAFMVYVLGSKPNAKYYLGVNLVLVTDNMLFLDA